MKPAPGWHAATSRYTMTCETVIVDILGTSPKSSSFAAAAAGVAARLGAAARGFPFAGLNTISTFAASVCCSSAVEDTCMQDTCLPATCMSRRCLSSAMQRRTRAGEAARAIPSSRPLVSTSTVVHVRPFSCIGYSTVLLVQTRVPLLGRSYYFIQLIDQNTHAKWRCQCQLAAASGSRAIRSDPAVDRGRPDRSMAASRSRSARANKRSHDSSTVSE